LHITGPFQPTKRLPPLAINQPSNSDAPHPRSHITLPPIVRSTLPNREKSVLHHFLDQTLIRTTFEQTSSKPRRMQIVKCPKSCHITIRNSSQDLYISGHFPHCRADHQEEFRSMGGPGAVESRQL